ncbi:MAG: hypothetical protein IH944_01195 [Armatimonadetes bacterium]|nr:hypothetical protein [Armatimonadota bacterium]
MAALTKAFEAYERPGLIVSYALSNVKVYKGAIVAVNATGHLVAADHATASLSLVGVAAETVDNSAGSPGDKRLNVTKSGSFVMKANGFTPAQADIGVAVYANTDWEVQVSTVGLTNIYQAGTIIAIETTSEGSAGVRVRIDNHTV